uniref:Fibronectin type-III domain-containing protein n=1 Tax=Anabas testudineus TaxID=64144 RepID=A0A3Q1HA38_ANATE
MHVTVTMDEVKLTCTNSDEREAQEIKNHGDTLPDLYNQVLQALSSSLSDNSIEELQLMQRSTYYLEIQRDDLLPASDQHVLRLSDSTVWSLIDQQRLQHAMNLAKTQVRLILTVLGLIYKEITRGCQELEAFIINYNRGLVDCNTVASVQQKLHQTHNYLNNFNTRMTCNLGPLELPNQLIPNTGHFPIPQLRVSLAIKMPVVFDRFESCAGSNSVYLSWDVAGKQSKEPNEQFEIQVRNLHPTTDDQDQFSKATCQSYNIQISNLISDRYYQFSVQRVDTVNLVYRLWTDTIILKTLNFSK